jgi:hypothetical protein
MRHARAHTTWGMARSIQRCTLRAARCVDVCRMPYALCFTFITCCLPSYNRQHATCNRRQATCNRRCACSILRTQCTARNELLTLRSVAEQNRALQHQIEVCGAAAGNRPAALLPQIESPYVRWLLTGTRCATERADGQEGRAAERFEQGEVALRPVCPLL